jgi:serine/threonine-protein kinase
MLGAARDESQESDTLDATEVVSERRASGSRIRVALPVSSSQPPPAPPRAASWAADALRAEEAARARSFARSVVAFCIVGLICQPALSGASWLHLWMAGTLVGLGLGTCWVAVRARDPERYTKAVSRTFAAMCLFASVTIDYYLGVFSPAPMFLAWGMTFFARSEDRVVSIGLSVATAALYVATAALVLSGIVPDAGAVRTLAAPAAARVPMVVMVPLVLWATVWQARRSRAATIEALDRAESAAGWAREREAMLEQVQNELEVLRAVGDRGKLVGTMAGDWELEELVGAGGMGEVYSATNAMTGQRGAVKVLSSRRLGNPAIVRRFLREGEAALRLDTPNVVRVFEIGETLSGVPFLAMELLEGHDLSFYLRERGRLGVDEVLDLVSQVAQGLEAAHAAGIVHRDLKPQNLFYCTQGVARPTWKILDFGISKWANSSGTITQHGVVGTPSYMSPEQARGVASDSRSDLFSLAVVAYRALTGRRAFSGPDLPQILFEVVYGVPARPTTLLPSLNPDVDAFFTIALAKNPDDRFRTASELVHALRRATFGALGDRLRAHAAKVQATSSRSAW